MVNVHQTIVPNFIFDTDLWSCLCRSVSSCGSDSSCKNRDFRWW